MSEETKPKATLIKHKKSEPPSSSKKAEAPPKKVVVVKKKKVVVRKAAPPAEEPKSPKTETEPALQDKAHPAKAAPSEAVTPKEQTPPVAHKPVREAPSGAPAARYQSDRPQAGKGRTPARPGEQRPRRAGNLAGGPPGRGDFRPGAPRGDTRPGAPRGDTRPGAPRGDTRPGAPQFRRKPNFKGPPPATPAPAPDAEKDARKHSKKTFKTKKKVDYTKKREESRERDFQIKKKQKHRPNPIPKSIDIMEVITVSELARKMNLKASELIAKLMSMGMMVTINQQIDSETAQLLASEFGCEVKLVSLYDETLIETESDSHENQQSRPPIVTVMGHVDHGKTKLLDAIRSSDVVAGEFGGITQHIGASTVSLPEGTVVFLDTPGHSAFTLMRSRGAQITDIVVLVVAANDGVMPQTVEAINHAKAAKVPIIVAVNKIDLPEANPERVKQQLSEYGLLPEAWGGQTLFCEISALQGEGIQELLDTILLQSEMLELKANYDCRAEGNVIESKVDHGRGIVATVIVLRGTLKVGDPFVAGVYSGKVRALYDDHGNRIDRATPSMPVEVVGFGGIPNAGSPFQVTASEKQSRMVSSKRQELERQGEATNLKKVTLDNLFDSLEEGDVQELKVIIKGDVHGSVEALQTALEKLSTSDIRLNVIHASAGAIVENDINLAVASNAIVIGFNVRPTPKAQTLADKEKIDVRKYNIIYDVVDDIRLAMEGMLAPDHREEVIGHVEIREIFKVPKIGTIAGCYVLDGKVKRNSTAHLLRDSTVVHTGKISSLKRFKDDARSVDAGYECGIGLENYQDLRVGDVLEIFDTIEVKKKL